MRSVTRTAIVERSSERLYALVEAIEDYPTFVPGCLASAVLSRSDERTVATLTLGWRAVRFTLETENHNAQPAQIEMHLREGPFRHFEAKWTFQALSAQACRVAFSVRYEFTNRLIDRAMNPVLQHVADGMVDAFVARAMGE